MAYKAILISPKIKGHVRFHILVYFDIKVQDMSLDFSTKTGYRS